MAIEFYDDTKNIEASCVVKSIYRNHRYSGIGKTKTAALKELHKNLRATEAQLHALLKEVEDDTHYK
jgi:hypothetical protein